MSSFEISKDFVDKVQKCIYDFIWNSKTPKVKNAVAVQDIESSGLKIPLVDIYIRANRALWAKRLLCEKNRNIQYLIFLCQT